MTGKRRSNSEPTESPRRRATTPEGRENQLIAMAVDLAEQQLKEGTASAQVISHFLKLGSTRERLEQERLMNENVLLQAKAESIASASRIEELIAGAIKAMRSYTGQEDPQSEEEYRD